MFSLYGKIKKRSIVPGYNLGILVYGVENLVFETIEKRLVLGGDNTCFLGEVNELGNGLSLHLLHDPAAMNLDRL